MRILILGGTRFLGLRVAEILVESGNDLTLLSRRKVSAPAGTCQICEERGAGIASLHGSFFDLVLDFICYDRSGIDELVANIKMARYVLISTTWLPRLWSGSRGDELVDRLISDPISLPSVTLDYLNGKFRAEHALAGVRLSGCKAVSLRLPIILGDGDPTGRLDFYRRRLTDDGPLILVSGGLNIAQIAVMEDLALTINTWLSEVEIDRFLVWEALPGRGRSVRTTIEAMAVASGMKVEIVDVPMAELDRDLPIYLDQEPLWRETELEVTAANIFATVGVMPAVFGQSVNFSTTSFDIADSLRLEELRFLAKRHNGRARFGQTL